MNEQKKNSDASEETPESIEGANDAGNTIETSEETPLVMDEEVTEAPPPSGIEEESDREAQIAELKDKLLRALADMENLRRRSQKDREDALKYSAANFARDMLSVGDNLRRAIEAIPEDDDTDGAALVAFIEGVALTEKDLLAALERHGIEKIEPMGQKFDPQFHEAMFEVPAIDAETGTVMHIVEVGYLIHDRLLRPAKVGIAKAAPKESGN